MYLGNELLLGAPVVGLGLHQLILVPLVPVHCVQHEEL